MSEIHAQQGIQISQYMFNTMAYNPAYAGFNGAICGTLLHRQQWFGFKEGDENVAPQTTLLNVDAPVRFLHGGIGVGFEMDQQAYFKDQTVKLAYAYHLTTSQGTLAFGTQIGFNDKTIDFAKFKAINSSDPVLATQSETSKMMMNVALGAYYYVEDEYEIGLSVNPINAASATDLFYKNKQTFNLSGAYNISLNNFKPGWELIPSTLIKTDFTSFQMDLTGLLSIDKKYWGGVSYRLGDAVVLLGGLTFEQFKIGVAYDISAGPFFKTTTIGGGFEVFVKYCFNLVMDKKPRSYKNSRFL